MVSLKYCDRPVRAAWRRVLKLQGDAPRKASRRDRSPSLRERIENLKRAVPTEVPGCRALAQALADLLRDEPGAHWEPGTLESRLEALGEEFVPLLHAALDEADQAQLDRSVQEALEPHRQRLEDAAVVRLERRLTQRKLWEVLALPELTLFSKVAQGES